MSDVLDGIDRICDELVAFHTEQLHSLAREIKPNVSYDDLMQSFDYPEMENYPVFKYQEGILAGIRVAYAALRADLKSR